jgi:hypothetical protein
MMTDPHLPGDEQMPFPMGDDEDVDDELAG